MSDVFISYARSTEVEAHRIAEVLRTRGYKVWRDDELPAHRAYSDVISERLHHAGAVLVLWSKDAAASHWVRAEADVALQAEKLIQVTFDGTRPPMPFNQIHCADLSDWLGEEDTQEWGVVLSSIKELTANDSQPEDVRGEDIASGRSDAAIHDDSDPGHRPALALPSKPSIAVLPFRNLSADSTHEYLADGISEDIVTALSRWRWFFVIASSSSFTYKGHDLDIKQIGRELGVRYVLEGSLRKTVDRIRISVQLIDAHNGARVWAESFDREIVDLLELQDEITEQVVVAVEPTMLHSEGVRHSRSEPTDFDALDCFYRGMWHFNKLTSDDYAKAISLFREAIQQDPDLSLGHIGLARVLFGRAIFGWSSQPIIDLREANNAAQTAIRLDVRDAYGYYARSVVSLYLGDHGAALSDARCATSLNPNFALGLIRLGQVLVYSGRPAEAIAPIERGVSLSPYDPQLGVTLEVLALAHYQAGNYAQAVAHAEASMHHRHDRDSVVLAAGLAQLGRIEEARRALPAARWAAASPERPMAAPYADPTHLEHLRQGIRLARQTSES